MHRFILAILIFSFIGFSLNAQTKDYFEVALKDQSNEEPISFATIRLKDSKQGLIADAEGEFRIPFAFKNFNAIFSITSIGYESIELIVSELTPNQINIFYLKPNVEELNAIVIANDPAKRRRVDQASALVKAARTLTADEIIYLAIKNIQTNLSALPSSVLGYYRDYQIVNDEYYNLNEGIVEMFDRGIRFEDEAYESFKASIYSYQQNNEFKQDSTYTVPYDREVKFIQNAAIRPNGGNELTILNVHNLIRNYNVATFSFVYVFKSYFLNNHNSRRNGIIYLNDEPLVQIRFETYPRVSGSSHKAFGNILISLKDYSIHRFNYEVFDDDKDNALFNLNIEYRRQNDKMYLNYITFNNRFIMMDKNILSEEDISFYPDEYKFRITFNKNINLNSVRKGCFNIKYGNQKLYIDEIINRSNASLELIVRPFFRDGFDQRSFNTKDLSFKMRKIKDLDGRKIYEPRLVIAYQFRELFIQEVFPEKEIPENTPLMVNGIPIEFSKRNLSENTDKYWLNSPLRQTVTTKKNN